MPVPVAADLSRLHVIVPVRGVSVGKSRLGEALDAEERLTLVVGLLVRTLSVVSAWSAATAVHVVSGDVTVRTIARRHPGVAVIRESGHGGLNSALLDGRRAAVRDGATAVLLLPADLPLLTMDALDALLQASDAAIAAGSGRPVVVLAPADARVGTNAMLVAPPETIEPRFGEQSLEAHMRGAVAADASLQLVHHPALGFDLDTPEDVERLSADELLDLHALGHEALDAVRHPAVGAEVA